MSKGYYNREWRNKETAKRYELWDLYETEIEGFGEILLKSDDKNEIMTYAKKYYKETDGECKLFLKEWID